MNYDFPVEHTVKGANDLSSLRLDAALGEVFSDLGLRARRRLWDWCLIKVNGKPRAGGFLVRRGDRVSIEAYESPERKLMSGIKLVLITPDYVVLHKPRGMHSAHIAGGSALSLESLLPTLWPALSLLKSPAPKLISRLDQGTSGLLLTARSEKAEEDFRKMEAEGDVHKYYCALVQGAPEEDLLIKNKVDMANRSKSLVLDEKDSKTRWTEAKLLSTAEITGKEKKGPSFMHGAEQLFFAADLGKILKDSTATHSLLAVKIKRGARHQIRAHLAFSGYPLAGDALYGGSRLDFLDVDAGRSGQEDNFLLHHGRLEFPGLTAVSMPDELVWLK